MAYDALCSAYAAYISGILINVVGFAGASESSLLSEPLWRWARHGPAEKKKHCTDTIDDASRGSPCCQAGRTVPVAATRIYELSFFTGFGVSCIVYYALNRLFPVVGAAAVFEEIDVSEYEGKSMEAHVGD